MEKNLAQRIIFTGPAGVKKKGVIDKLIEEFLSHKNAKKEEENRYFRRLSIEEEIKEKLDAKHILTFLSEKKYNQQQQIWKQAFDQLRKKVEETPSNIHLLIEFHSCYFLGQKRLPFWSFPRLILSIRVFL